jgi:hypothetical protein
LFFLDDDAFVNETTYPSIIIHLSEFPNDIAFGTRIIQGLEISAHKLKRRPTFDIFRWSLGEFNIEGEGYINCEHLQGTSMCFRTDALVALGGFCERLAIGYASFEETELFLRLNKQYRTMPKLILNGSVTHGVSPRLNGFPRDIGKSVALSYSFARNGIYSSKVKYGRFRTVLAIPVVYIINAIRIFRRAQLSEYFRRFYSLIGFTAGIARGLFLR